MANFVYNRYTDTNPVIEIGWAISDHINDFSGLHKILMLIVLIEECSMNKFVLLSLEDLDVSNISEQDFQIENKRLLRELFENEYIYDSRIVKEFLNKFAHYIRSQANSRVGYADDIDLEQDNLLDLLDINNILPFFQTCVITREDLQYLLNKDSFADKNMLYHMGLAYFPNLENIPGLNVIPLEILGIVNEYMGHLSRAERNRQRREYIVERLRKE
jgi:hypothetical protein